MRGAAERGVAGAAGQVRILRLIGEIEELDTAGLQQSPEKMRRSARTLRRRDL